MEKTQWRVMISHPDYCPQPNVFQISTTELSGMTRNDEFSEMIEGSGVLGGLIAASEAIQDKVCS